MSRFNTLLHGEAADAAAMLNYDQPPIGKPLVTRELRAALTNALHRIDRLEYQINQLKKDYEGRGCNETKTI